jgi:phage tail protein X
MSTTLYRTREGETVDEICFRVFDSTANNVVEETYRLNQNLAEYGETLPSGLLIVLPDVAAIAIARNSNAQTLFI